MQEDTTEPAAGKDFGVLSPGTWRVAGQDVKHAMIRRRRAWGWLPLWALEEDLAEGRLKRLEVAALGRHGRVELESYPAHRRDQPLGPAARTLREGLLSHLHGAPRPGCVPTSGQAFVPCPVVVDAIAEGEGASPSGREQCP